VATLEAAGAVDNNWQGSEEEDGSSKSEESKQDGDTGDNNGAGDDENEHEAEGNDEEVGDGDSSDDEQSGAWDAEWVWNDDMTDMVQVRKRKRPDPPHPHKVANKLTQVGGRQGSQPCQGQIITWTADPRKKYMSDCHRYPGASARPLISTRWLTER
jgi:hypothetical protein